MTHDTFVRYAALCKTWIEQFSMIQDLKRMTHNVRKSKIDRNHDRFFSFHDKNTTSWKRESSIDKDQWKKSCDFYQWKIAFFSPLHPGRSLHETASDLNLLTFRSDIVRGPLAFIDIKLYRLRRLYWLWDVLEDGSARELCASDSLCRCVAEQLARESAGAICILLTVW